MTDFASTLKDERDVCDALYRFHRRIGNLFEGMHILQPLIILHLASRFYHAQAYADRSQGLPQLVMQLARNTCALFFAYRLQIGR